MTGLVAAVDLHDEVRRRQPAPHVEIPFDEPDGALGGRVQVVARVGLERAVIAQEAQRPRAPPGYEAPGGGKLVDDPAEQQIRLRGRTFVSEPGLGHELPHPETLVVATAGRIVVLRQPVEECARHGDLNPCRCVGRTSVRRRPARRALAVPERSAARRAKPCFEYTGGRATNARPSRLWCRRGKGVFSWAKSGGGFTSG